MQFKMQSGSPDSVPRNLGSSACTLCDLHSDPLVCKMTCHKKCVHKIQSYCSYTGRRKVST